MLKDHASLWRRLMIFLDICFITASLCVGHFVGCNIDKNICPLFNYLIVFPVYILIWISLLYFFGVYSSFRTRPVFSLMFIIFKSAVLNFIIFAGVVYILKLDFISRKVMIFSGLLCAGVVTVEKIALVNFFRRLRKKGYNFRNILIAGTNKRAQNFIALIEQHSEWGLKIIGLIDDDPALKGCFVRGYKVIGTFKEIPCVLQNNIIDEIVFIVPRSWLDKIEEPLRFCESQGIKIHLAVDHFDLKLAQAKQTDLHGFPLISFESAPDNLWQLLIKRLFDIFFSAGILIMFSPLLAVISILIKLTSKGPVVFKQERCGLNGRRFFLYKFRTMVEGAEAKLEELRGYNEMQGPVFKMSNDPRLTPIGRFLRKYSLDEMPQFWNVFKGHMSLIGPRPPLPKEVEKYDAWQRRRLSMKPGVSCLWQIKGRNKITDFNEWMKLDLEYIDNWSLVSDFAILVKTVPAVLSGSGAK